MTRNSREWFTLGRVCRSAVLVLLGSFFASPGHGADPARLFDLIHAETEVLRTSGQVSYAGIDVLEPELVAEIYERNRFAPLWTDPVRVAALPAVVRSSYDDGLHPGNYHLERIERVLESQAAGRSLTDRGLAVFDLLLTDSLARLVLDLRFGSVDRALHPGDDPPARRIDGLEPVLAIEQLIDSQSLSSALTSVLPRSPQYLRLRAALQQYRSIANAGGWPAIPDGPTITPGSRDPRVGTLVRRLAATADLAAGDAEFTVYDDVLQEAVRRFQARHGLETDAEIGPATLRAMNVPVNARIDQIRINLERARWFYDVERQDFVLVNVPAFRAFLIRDGATIWTSRVIVGEVDTETPLFQSQLKYVVLNPTWTVPYKIASEELLPSIQKDPSFLSRGGYELFDRAGDPVDPAQVDWTRFSRNNFPFTLVQQPGPANQLGSIKFVFPNEYAVFMHDTPAKSLFDKACRAFSHGCIRLDQPVEFAAQLLERESWSRERLYAQLEVAETQTIFLDDPLPVFIVYWTAAVDDGGNVHFFDDIYARDSAVLDALDAPRE